MKLGNPFPEYGYFGPECFCDREQETEELISALVNGSNIACEGKVNAPTSLDFILRHQLPAPSSIKMALKSLQDKEFLFYDTKQGYMVYDRFFGMWLKRLAGM